MAIVPILRSNLRHLARRPYLAVVAILGIALGVALASGIDLAIASARRGFTAAVGSVAGTATDVISAGPSGLPDTAVADLLAQVGGIDATPLVESLVGVAGHPGLAIRLIGLDPISDARFGGPAPGGAGDVTALLTRGDAIALSASAAATLGVSTGATLTLTIGTRRAEVHVVSVLPAAALGSSPVAVCDISTAQVLLGRHGRIDRILVRVPPAARAALAAAVLPPGATLAPAEARTQALLEMTRAFDTNLTAMGLLAVVVSVFLIYNTVDFLAVARRPLLARLRLQGATAAEIGGALALEALLLGAVGSIIGLALGVGCARLLLIGVTRTITDLWFVVDVRSVVLAPTLLLANLGIGLGATLLAAAPSLIASMRLPPQVAVVAATPHPPRWRSLAAVAALGVVGLAASVGLLVLDPHSLALGFAAIGCVIVGAALLVPLLLALALAGARRPLAALGGPVVGLALAAARAALARTSVAIAALAVATAASLGVQVMVHSFRTALSAWLDSTLQADVYLSAPRPVAARTTELPLPPDLVERLARTPGVAAMVTKRDAHPQGRDGPVDVAAFDLPPQTHRAFHILGVPAPDLWSRFAAGGCLITEPFASRHRLTVGGSVALRTDHGWHDFPVLAVIRDYSSDQGTVLLALPVYRQWWEDRAISACSFYAQPGVEAHTLVERLRAAAAGDLLQIDAQSDLRRASLAVFDRTFAITRAMQWLAAAVAFLGVLSAMTAQGLERQRELAVVRMHGATPLQVGALLTLQALASGLTAGLLAVPLGLVLARLLIVVINHRSFGWSFDLAVPPVALATAVGLAVAASVAACGYPAWRSMRASPARVLAEAT